ncbi:MAG: peptidylprolyl isomerase [Paraprevotella sp.]|nr:peptidylprolyl isomerase [Paraprevotella sp.]
MYNYGSDMKLGRANFAVRVLLLFLAVMICFGARAGKKHKKERRSVVRLETSAGVIRIALSDLTPLHRDNFLRLAEEGFYDGLLFHRVIKGFMIQAGDPSSREAPRDSLLGEGGPGYTLPAEIVFPELYHVRGSVAAPREGDDVNPEFRSSGSQFYIVWGKRMQPAPLRKAMSYLAEKGIELNRFMLNDYQMYGGTPHLDGSYTVFGHVIEGLDVVEAIQAVTTDASDRPLEDVVVIRATVESRSREAVAAQK